MGESTIHDFQKCGLYQFKLKRLDLPIKHKHCDYEKNMIIEYWDLTVTHCDLTIEHSNFM